MKSFANKNKKDNNYYSILFSTKPNTNNMRNEICPKRTKLRIHTHPQVKTGQKILRTISNKNPSQIMHIQQLKQTKATSERKETDLYSRKTYNKEKKIKSLKKTQTFTISDIQ